MRRMYKEVKIQTESTECHKYCDICGAEIGKDLACTAARCQICRKDLCKKCIGTEKDTVGDYRDVWCIACWEIGKKYIPDIRELERKTIVLYNAWYDECKEEQA